MIQTSWDMRGGAVATTERVARHAVSSKGSHNVYKNEEVKEIFRKEPKGLDGIAAD